MEASRQAPAAAGPVAGTPAPFMQAPNGPAPAFGMAQGVEPNAELAATLNQHFPFPPR